MQISSHYFCIFLNCEQKNAISLAWHHPNKHHQSLAHTHVVKEAIVNGSSQQLQLKSRRKGRRAGETWAAAVW